MATASSAEGKLATAGISYGWLYDRKTKEKYGGLVCEYACETDREYIKCKLNMSINELYNNGFIENYELRDIHTIVESFKVTKSFGTAIVALCFIDYVIPIIG
jgi:arginine decarboxylase